MIEPSSAGSASGRYGESGSGPPSAAGSVLGGYGGSRRGPPFNQSATWRLPPIPVLLVGVVLIACAEVGGASMVQWKL